MVAIFQRRPVGDSDDASGPGGHGHDTVLVRGFTRSPIVQEMVEESSARAKRSQALGSRTEANSSNTRQCREKDGKTEKKTRKKRTRDREIERRNIEVREEGKRRRKEGEEGGSKVVEAETDWVTVKRRTEQRRQQGRDEASVKSDGKRFRTIQIFVKVDGYKAFPLAVSLSDNVADVVIRIPSSAQDNKRDVHMRCGGRVIRRSDDLKNCGIGDGSTVQAMNRMRGGGRHKAKTSKAARKRDRSPEKPNQTLAQEKLSLSWSTTPTSWMTTETEGPGWSTETKRSRCFGNTT